MNREIKFRIWDKRSGVFVNKYLITSDGELKYYSWDGLETVDEYENKDLIIQQYTGVKDKNNKEIYEGDILHYINSESKYCDPPLERIDEIIYEGSGFFFNGILLCDVYLNDLILKFEIIGNIFQNPELLEKNEN